jgi:drug/metabolite transporter (DMT)-like permease
VSVDARSPRRTERWALAAAALVGVQVGACIAGSRWVVPALGPVPLTFLRYAIALACLVPFVRGARAAWAALTVRELVTVALLGIGQTAVLIGLLNFGLQAVDAGLGALLFATFPLLTLAVATLAGHERFDATLAAGVLLTIVGVGVALGVHPVAPTDAGFLLGAASILAAALCGALCTVAYRPLLARHSMLPLGALAMASAVLLLWPLAWADGLVARSGALSAAQWSVLAAVGVSSGLGYWVWLWVLKHIAPTLATTFLALSPVTAALIGHQAMGEPIGLGLVVGMLCIAAGLAISASRRAAPVRAAMAAVP